MRLSLFFLFALISVLVIAQPENDNCDSSINLGVAPNCLSTLFSNTNATTSNISITENIPTCWSNAGADVWFQFQVPADGSIPDVQLEINGLFTGGTPIGSPSIAIYVGDCAIEGLIEIACQTSLLGTTNATIDIEDLSPGTVYYVRVQDNSATALPTWGDFSICVQAMPIANITANASTETLCLANANTLQLSVTGDSFIAYQWEPANLVVSPNSANTSTLPLNATTTFTVTGLAVTENLIVNGDFEAGNTGFTSALNFVTSPSTGMCQGCYQIAPFPPSQWTQCDDNTPTPGVNQLISNAATVAGVNVWCQTVNVTQGEDYIFSGFVQTINTTSPPNLSFLVNGTSLGNGASTTNCNWTNLSFPWNSGTSTTANLCIVNLNISPNGNDFGLDDLYFGIVESVSDQVTITVNNLDATITNVTADNCTFTCDGTATVLATGSPNTVTYTWSSSNNSAATAINLCPGTYTVSVTDNICTATATSVILGNTFSANAVSTSNPCEAQATGTALAVAQGGVEPYSYMWDNGSSTATAEFSTPGLHTVTITDNVGCSDTAIVEVNIYTDGFFINYTANNDTICFGESAILTAAASPNAVVTYSNGQQTNVQTVTPLASTTYFAVALTTTNNNVVTNGNFEAGNFGFTTDYALGAGGVWGLLSNPGTYGVAESPNDLHSNFFDCSDVTTGGGNMFVANGSSFANVNVWCQNVNVSPNTDYQFSAWVGAAVSDNLSSLQFNINGNALGSVFSPSPTQCNWTQFFNLWNSGANTTAQICIVNQNVGGGGNDFMLDDISLAPICKDTAFVTITVISPNVNTETTATTCGEANGAILVNANDGAFPYLYSIDGGTLTNDNNFDSLPAGTYQVLAQDAYGCTANTIANVASSVGALLEATAIPTTCGLNDGMITWTTSSAMDSVWLNTELQTSTAAENIAAGNYILIVIDNENCTDTTQVSVDSSLPFDLQISTPNGTSFCGFEQLPINTNAVTALWSNGQTETNIEADTSNLFFLVGADINGCSDSASITLTPCTEFSMPTAFSPNGDQLNETFGPIPTSITIIHFEVYNRFGQKVYNGNQPWDGSANGDPQPSDLYNFIISAQIGTAPAVSKHGEVLLLR